MTTRFDSMGFSTTNRLAENFEDKWVDIAFRIQPDGHVGDVRIVRGGSDRSWARAVLDSIPGRIYTPGDPASPSSNRVERYTYTSGYAESRSTTRTAQRSPVGRIEYLDMTPDAENALRGGQGQ